MSRGVPADKQGVHLSEATRVDRSTSLTARLSAGLTLLLVLAIAFTTVDVRHAVAQRRDSVRIEELTDEVSMLLDLEIALDALVGFRDGIAKAESFGISPAIVLQFSGVDLEQGLVDAGRATREAVDRLGARAPFTTGRVDDAQAIDGYAELVTLTVEQREARIDELGRIAESSATGFGLSTAVEDLGSAVEVSPEATRLTLLLLDLATAASSEDLVARAEMVVASRQRLIGHLEKLTERPGPIRDATTELQTSETFVELIDLTDVLLTDRLTSARLSGSLTNTDFDVFSKVWVGSHVNAELAQTVAHVASEELSTAGADLGRAALGDMQRSILMAIGLLVLASLVVVWFLRLIVRPLRVLESSAGALADGELPDSPRHLGGARELRTTADAMARLVGTLTLIERQAHALATGEIDDPVLDRSAPGRLGDAVGGAIERLRTSIGESRELTTRLEHDAGHDPLTGIANRREAFRILHGSADGTDGVALFYLDLDGFKEVNDRYGHDAGDAVLTHVADRLAEIAGSGDVAARLGGDEFLVVATRPVSVEQAGDLAARMLAGIEQPVELPQEHETVSVSASIGVALGSPGDDPDALLGRADAAMYRAKAAGSGEVVIATPYATRTDVGSARIVTAT